MSLPSLLQTLCPFPKSIWQLQQEDTVKGRMVSCSSLTLKQFLCFLRGWHQGQEGHRTPQNPTGHPAPRTRLEKLMFLKTKDFSFQRTASHETLQLHLSFSMFYFYRGKKKSSITRNHQRSLSPVWCTPDQDVS